MAYSTKWQTPRQPAFSPGASLPLRAFCQVLLSEHANMSISVVGSRAPLWEFPLKKRMTDTERRTALPAILLLWLLVLCIRGEDLVYPLKTAKPKDVCAAPAVSFVTLRGGSPTTADRGSVPSERGVRMLSPCRPACSLLCDNFKTRSGLLPSLTHHLMHSSHFFPGWESTMIYKPSLPLAFPTGRLP